MAVNDVVRHVILRILVDQEGLAEDLAAARAKLKALKDSERDINKERGKSADEVTGKLRDQNKVLGENAQAHDANRRARTTTSDKAETLKAETAAIKENTAVTDKQTVAEARAAAVRQEADRKDRESAEKNRQAGLNQRSQRGEAKKFGETQRTEATAFGQTQREVKSGNAEAERIRKAAESQANSTRKDTTAAEDTIRKDKAAADTQINKDKESATRIANQKAESEARKATSVTRTAGVEAKNTDVNTIAENTRDVRQQAVTDRATSQSSVAQSTASAAQSREETAATSALTAEERKLTAETSRQNKALSEQESLRQRRVQTTRQVKALENDITKASQQGELLEQRIAAATESRARAAERQASTKSRQQTILGSIGSVVSDVAVAGARSVISAPKASVRRAATTAANTSDLDEIQRKATTVSGRVEKLFGDLGKKISRSVGEGAEDAASKLGKLTQHVRGYIDSINRPREGGSGKSLFSDLLTNLGSMGDKLSGALQKGSGHLLSFQSLIIAVIAALGPLAAILGAVGAAALALASDIGALAGGFLALPGLIGAAVAGFGALAIVMKPLTSVFSAYSAAQKAAATTTGIATDALNDYRIAQINAQQAQIDWKRAQADAPRAEQALKDARKDATRQLEDYTTALKKLRFEQEGASLDVLSAEQQARRAMADPTASSLDRRIAVHDVQGALFDQQDQATTAKRTRQDASEAFGKGVDGADAVVEANRAVEDSARKIDLAYLQWQKDIVATEKAKKSSTAGGDAAAAYQAQIDKLPPATKKVAQAVIDLIKPDGPFQKMRNLLSEEMFGPLSKDTGKFKTVLGELQTFLEPAAKAIGILAKNALDLFTNPAWKDFFARQGVESGKIIGKLGQAALDAANGFRSVVEVARPFTDFVVDGILGMARSFDKFATSDSGRKSILGFLQTTRVRMAELWPILKNFAIGIGEFFTALNKPSGGQKDFTSWFNDGLKKASDTFVELGKKANDPNGGFQKWLITVRPLLHDIVGFLSGAAGFAGKLFSDNRNIDEARRILKEISGTWLPQLKEIFGKLSESGLVSKLAAAIGSVFTGLNDFFDHGGLTTLSVFASTLEAAGKGFSTVAGWIDTLTKKFPVLDGVVKVLGGTLALIFGAALVAKISGLTGLVTNLIKASKGIGKIVASVRDPDPKATSGKSRFTRVRQGATDAVKDAVLLGRDQGVSAARRRTREAAKPQTDTGSKPSSGTRTGTRPTAPTVDLTGTGGVIPHLSRMEVLLQRIAANTARYGSGGGGGGGSEGGTRTGKPPSPPSGGGAGSSRTSSRRSRTTPWPERPTSPLDRVPTGREAVPAGIDPNSKEGMAYRQAAVGKLDPKTKKLIPGTSQLDVSTKKIIPGTNEDRLKVIRDSGGTTRLGQTERNAVRDIANPPTIYNAPKKSRLSRMFGGLGRGAAALGGAVAGTGVDTTPRSTDVSWLPELPLGPDDKPLPYTYTEPQDTATYKPPKAGAKRQTIPGLQDAYTVPLPREPLPASTGFEPYTNIAGPPQASRKTRIKGKAGRLGKGLLGGLGTVASVLGAPFLGGNDVGAIGTGGLFSGTTPIAGGGNQFDEGYDEGYEDALSQLGGGQQQLDLPDRDEDKKKGGKKGKKGQRPGSREQESRRPASKSRSSRRGSSTAAEDDEGPSRKPGERRPGRPSIEEPDEPSRPSARRGVSAIEDDVEQAAKGGKGKGGLLSRLFSSGGKKGAAGIAEEGIEDVVKGGGKKGVAGVAEEGIKDLVKGGGKKGAAGIAEEGIEAVAKTGGKSLLRGAAGGLLRGAAGGVGGIVAGAAVSLGGNALIDKFVKNDKDKGSLQRGLGAVAQGAGIGATIGSIIPGVGTVIGGAVGGVVGGAYSLIKDKNLRNFVGGKISSGAKKVGGFFKNIWDGGDDDDPDVQPGHGAGQIGGKKPGGIKSFFSGIKDTATSGLGGGIATALGPLGLLAAKTDIGKMIIGSLNKAGSAIGKFFTKTIPDFFHKGVQGIETFFTKTLPSLPGKFFDMFFIGIGRMIRFFTVTLPDAAVWLFTTAIPDAAKAAWKFVVNDLWDPFLSFVKAIPGFFTKTIPHWFETAQTWYKKHVTEPVITFITKTVPNFFTVTIPKWFEEAPHWFKVHVIDNVMRFFTVTIPSFFTVTLPNVMKALPGFLYDHLVQPILDFFKGLAGHVGDFLKGSWNWAKGLFTRAGKDVQQGEQGKMSGGLIAGVYQGIEDTTRLRATPGEFVVRRSKVQQTGGKAFLDDFNEGRFQISDLYKGLSASTTPQVMAMVPPEAMQLSGRVPSVMNNTVNQAPLMGDVTIHNPIRERSESTLRRQIHIAAIRHRR